MQINQKCLQALLKIMQRQKVTQLTDVKLCSGNQQKNHIATMNIFSDGRVQVTWSIAGNHQLPLYEHPSAVRASLYKKNGATYSHLYLHGQSLRSLGVSP